MVLKGLLGDLLRHARQHRGLSCAELAEACGVSEGTIRDYELGRVGNPGTLGTLAEALDLPLGLLQTLAGKAQAPPVGAEPVPDDGPPAEDEAAAARGVTPATAIAEIHGYASVWDIVDADNEIVRRGAFPGSSPIPLFWTHGYIWDPVAIEVGTIYHREDDAHGHFFKSFVADTRAGRDMVAAMELREELGVPQMQASVGFERVENGTVFLDDGRLELLRSNLVETSIVTWPANEATSTWLVRSGPEGERAAAAQRLAAVAGVI